jgi:hypothetical protein
MPEEDPTSEDIRFTNIVMDAGLPIRLWSGDEEGEHRGKVRRISFSGMDIRGRAWSLLEGTERNPMEEIKFSDVDFCLGGQIPAEGRIEEVPFPTPRYGVRSGVPYGLFARKVRGLTMHGVRFGWDETADGWKDGLHLDSCADVDLSTVRAAPGQVEGGVAIRARETANLRCNDCRPMPYKEGG